MKIENATPMKAEMTIAPDKDGAEHYLLVIKGSYDIPADGSPLGLATAQRPLVYADQYHGDPSTTSIREAFDFAFRKPRTDVLVVGSACAPSGSRVQSLEIRLRVGTAIDKTIRVVGDRVWQRGRLSKFKPSEPLPFERMAVVYERAFGGSDTRPSNPKRHRFHRENLVGVGVYASSDPEGILGARLPNLERPGKPLSAWGKTTGTACFGFVSPHWRPRANHAGTYDQAWLDSRYPLLPDDFDERFHQAAPEDQVIGALGDGEPVAVSNMHPEGDVAFRVPPAKVPIVFMFKDRGDQHFEPRLDTMVIWPNERQVSLVWRLTVKCVGKLYSLRRVVVGDQPARWFVMQRSVKPYYPSLADYIESKQRP